MNVCLLNSDEIQLNFAMANGYIPVYLLSFLGITPSSCPNVIILNGVQWTLKDKNLKSAHYERKQDEKESKDF